MVLIAQTIDNKEVIHKNKVNGVWILERKEDMNEVDNDNIKVELKENNKEGE